MRTKTPVYNLDAGKKCGEFRTQNHVYVVLYVEETKTWHLCNGHQFLQKNEDWCTHRNPTKTEFRTFEHLQATLERRLRDVFDGTLRWIAVN
jgi:hypothetical protein